MARETLPVALELMFGDEGGYSNTKTDRGNYLYGVLVGTKYGVTGATLAAHRGKKAVTTRDVKAQMGAGGGHFAEIWSARCVRNG